MEGVYARCGDEARGYRLSGCRYADFGLNVDHWWTYRVEWECADNAGILDYDGSGGRAVYASDILGSRRIWRL